MLIQIKKSYILLLFIVFITTDYAYSSIEGYIKTTGNYYTHKENIWESRSRIFIKENFSLTDSLNFHISGLAEGLISNRQGDTNAGLVRFDETYFDIYHSFLDIRMGYAKLTWGKLDEIQPTDIVNPLNVAEYFMTGRNDSKLPVLLFRPSIYLGDRSKFGFVIIPFFKKGTFDEIQEKNSLFNIVNLPGFSTKDNLPEKKFTNMEYGGRFSTTFKKVDWSVCYLNGFRDFPMYKFIPQKGIIREDYPKLRMSGADFEFVVGKYGIRGEGAYFLNNGFQKEGSVDYIKNDSFQGGIGIDRKFEDNYLNIGLLYKSIFGRERIEDERNEMNITITFEKKFSYETKIFKCFFIYNLQTQSIFSRTIFSINLLENLWVNFSVGIIEGDNIDVLSRLSETDFIIFGLKYNF